MMLWVAKSDGVVRWREEVVRRTTSLSWDVTTLGSRLRLSPKLVTGTIPSALPMSCRPKLKHSLIVPFANYIM